MIGLSRALREASPQRAARSKASIRAVLLCATIAALASGCGREARDAPAGSGQFTYEIVATFPHDPTAFTQGLVFHDGYLFESTGQYGESRLRRVELETGVPLQDHRLEFELFGEGLTIFGDEIFQLTYREGTGIVYDLATLREKRRWPYSGEGWGLTHNGRELIMSDGSNRLRFLDPKSGKPLRAIEVKRDGRPLEHLNELEFIDGVIFANVFMRDVIARIDPLSGEVLGFVDLRGLRNRQPLGQHAEVLNGIAYDAESKRIFVTGKYWSKLFEIRLVPKPLPESDN